MKYFLILFCVSVSLSSQTSNTNSLDFRSVDSVHPINQNEEQILQRIEMGDPTEIVIRFKKKYINIFSNWCYTPTDTKPKLVFIGPSSLIPKYNGYTFYSNGKTKANRWGDFFQEFPSITYEINDSVLIINDSFKTTINKKKYIIVDHTEKEIFLQEIESSINSEVRYQTFFGKKSGVLYRTDSIQSLPIQDNIIGEWMLSSQIIYDETSKVKVNVNDRKEIKIEFTKDRDYLINAGKSYLIWNIVSNDSIYFYKKEELNRCSEDNYMIIQSLTKKSKLMGRRCEQKMEIIQVN